MRQYRLYCLNEHGSFTRSLELEAIDDDDALAKARAMKLRAPRELWNHNRLVAAIPVHK